jgi:membrane protease YdiL (CAAX protease family)
MPAPVLSLNSNQALHAKTLVPTFMLFMVAALVMRSLIESRLGDAGLVPGTAKHLSALAGFVILFLLLCPLLARSSWPKLILGSVGLGIVLWLGQMLTLLAVTPLDWPNTLRFSVPTAPSYAFACQNTALLWLAIPVLVVITPIVEETIHRGIILRALLPAGRAKAIFLSAVLFAVLHKPATMPYAFVFSVFLALQAIHYGNLFSVIITHGVTNLLVVLSATCIAGHWRPGLITWTAFSPATLIIVSLLTCLIAAWALATQIRVGADSLRSAPTDIAVPSQTTRQHAR